MKSANIYGEPIYVQETATKEEENKIREQLKNVLLDLYKIQKFNFIQKNKKAINILPKTIKPCVK